jgi:short-subunit dehydrogenase
MFINISSAAGKAGMVLRTAYCGSKFGLIGFFESLRNEVAHFGLSVTNVCPGFIQSNIAKFALLGDGNSTNKDDANISKGIPADK